MSEIQLYRLQNPDVLVVISGDEFDWKTRMHNFDSKFIDKNLEFFENNDPYDLFHNIEPIEKTCEINYETFLPTIRDVVFPNFTYSFITSKDQYESISESLKQNNINYVYWKNCDDCGDTLYWLTEPTDRNETIFTLLSLECANHIVFE